MTNRKLAIATVAIGLVLGGCSSTKVADVGNGTAVPAGSQQSLSEQRLSNDFRRQGVKVIYSLSGQLDAIEVTGYAPVWGNSQNAARESFRVAELEAKKSLNDFINKETIRTTTSVNMISSNLEKANDNKTNKIATNNGRDVVASETAETDMSVEALQNQGTDTASQENVAVRNDALSIATKVNNTIRVSNQGIIGGLYLVEGNVINDGKNVQVVMRWDVKHTAVRAQIRNAMVQ